MRAQATQRPVRWVAREAAADLRRLADHQLVTAQLSPAAREELERLLARFEEENLQ